MPRNGITARRIVTGLTVSYLPARLVGAGAGCHGRSPAVTPSPSALPSPDKPLAETSSMAKPTIKPATAQARDAAAGWLRANAIPFKTTEPGSGFEDLMPIEKLIGDARIVALDEATRGIHEFFQMKHRLVEFLVEEMGFTIRVRRCADMPCRR